MVGEVVHLISDRVKHLIGVHIVAMPFFVGWTFYQLLNGYIFIPIQLFSITLSPFQLGFFIGVLGIVGMKFIIIDGIEHYQRYDKFIGKETHISESNTQFDDIERIKPGQVQFKVFRDSHRDKQAMVLREDEVAIEV